MIDPTTYEFNFTNPNIQTTNVIQIGKLNERIKDYAFRKTEGIISSNFCSRHTDPRYPVGLIDLLDNIIRILIKNKCLIMHHTNINIQITALKHDAHHHIHTYTDTDSFYINILHTTTEEFENKEQPLLAYINDSMAYEYPNVAQTLIESANHKTAFIYTSDFKYIVITNKASNNILLKAFLYIIQTNKKAELDNKQQEIYDIIFDFLSDLINKDTEAVNTSAIKLDEYCNIHKIREQYTHLFKYDYERTKQHLENTKRNLHDKIGRYLTELHYAYQELEDINTRFKACKALDDDYVKEIVDYLVNNPYLDIADPYIDDNRILLRVYAPIMYYDDDYLETILDERYYSDDSPEYLLFNNIFLNKEYTFWTYSLLYFDLTNFNTTPYNDDGLRNTKSYFPHPHIMEYHCQGNHENEIEKWIQNHDYIGCFEQIISMAMNFNFYDDIVLDRFISNIIDNFYHRNLDTIKTFEKDGKWYSFNDILEEQED